MKGDQQQPWRIYLHAKAKNFDFKFKATKFLPTCKFFQFSLLLKLSPLHFKVKSQPLQLSIPKKQKSFKSKFLGALKKIRVRFAKTDAIAARKPPSNEQSSWLSHEGPVCVGTVVIGNLTLLTQSIYEKDKKGIMIHCLSILLYLVSLLKNFRGRKAYNLVIVSNVAMVGWAIWLHMKNHLGNGKKGCVSRYVSKAWNCVASSKCFYALSQEFILGSGKSMR